jgi:hypothetical protein
MNNNTIKDLAITAINSSDSYAKAIAGLQEQFAGQDEHLVRATLLPIVAAHYGVATGVAKSGPTAGKLAFIAKDKENKEEKTRVNTASQKLLRLVNAICSEAPELTAAQKKAANLAAAMKAVGKLTPTQQENLVRLIASELGLKVK